MDDVIRMLEKEEWDAALSTFLKYTESGFMDDSAYIIGASIMEHYQRWETMFLFITEG